MNGHFVRELLVESNAPLHAVIKAWAQDYQQNIEASKTIAMQIGGPKSQFMVSEGGCLLGICFERGVEIPAGWRKPTGPRRVSFPKKTDKALAATLGAQVEPTRMTTVLEDFLGIPNSIQYKDPATGRISSFSVGDWFTPYHACFAFDVTEDVLVSVPDAEAAIAVLKEKGMEPLDVPAFTQVPEGCTPFSHELWSARVSRLDVEKEKKAMPLP